MDERQIKQDWEKSVLLRGVLIGAIVLLIIPRQSFGKNISSMYEENDLRPLVKVYVDNIRWNWEHVIKQVLTKQERIALQRVQLEFPLIGEGGDPFRCCTRVAGEKPSILIPIFSIKFVDDLSTAVAWLHHNGFAADTVPEYISMLKYQEAERFPGGRYLSPLEGLRIPKDALKNSKVEEEAQELLKSTVIYLLSRELGFLYLSQPYVRMKQMKQTKTSWREQMIRKERSDLILRSDAFALEIMRRASFPPVGLTSYLSAQTYWTQNRIDFSDEKAYLKYRYSVPESALFPKRLYNIANLMVRGKEDYARKQSDRHTTALQIERSAREIFRLMDILNNESRQREIRQETLTREVTHLTPRRRPK